MRGRAAKLIDEHITAWQGTEATGEAVFSFEFARTARRLRSLPLSRAFFAHVETALDELQQALPAPLLQQYQLGNVVCNGITSCFAAFRAAIEQVARKKAQGSGDGSAGGSSKQIGDKYDTSSIPVDDALTGKDAVLTSSQSLLIFVLNARAARQHAAALWPRARLLLQCTDNCSHQEDYVAQLFQAASKEDDVSIVAFSACLHCLYSPSDLFLCHNFASVILPVPPHCVRCLDELCTFGAETN